jgi:hypothetical protein
VKAVVNTCHHPFIGRYGVHHVDAVRSEMVSKPLSRWAGIRKVQ